VFDAADGRHLEEAATIGHGLLGDLSADHLVMTEREAARLGRGLWSLEFDAVRLDTEKDDTFRVETADGQRYVLKVANPAEDPADIDFESQVMEHEARAECPCRASCRTSRADCSFPSVTRPGRSVWHA
jgi:Ser/Thr protein kinase RdoA (MazF antagonist)